MKSKQKNGIYYDINRTALTVNELPPYWREWLFNEQLEITTSQKGKNKGQGYFALAVLIVTGCSPYELESGFNISLLTRQLIKITFYEDCASHHDLHLGQSDRQRSGQTNKHETRHIYVHLNCEQPAIAFLFSCCKHQPPFQSIIYHYKTDRITKLICNLSEKFDQENKITKKGLRITPKTFRHEFAAQLFMSGLYTTTEISELLGLKDESSLVGYATRSNTPPIKTRIYETKKFDSTCGANSVARCTSI